MIFLLLRKTFHISVTTILPLYVYAIHCVCKISMPCGNFSSKTKKYTYQPSKIFKNVSFKTSRIWRKIAGRKGEISGFSLLRTSPAKVNKNFFARDFVTFKLLLLSGSLSVRPSLINIHFLYEEPLCMQVSLIFCIPASSFREAAVYLPVYPYSGPESGLIGED